MRGALAVLCTCVLFILGAFVAPAEAGGYRYYGDGYYPRYGGYYPRYGGNVWYSSKCCYKKIIRHDARFVRIDPWHHHGHYYGRPWREGYYGDYYGGYRGGYYGRVGYSDVYVGPAHRYNGYPPGYFNGGYNGYNGHNGYHGYDGYDAYNSAACIQRRVPVLDGRGGWVWGFKQVCN